MAYRPSQLIYCKKTRRRGRGVFAQCPIAADTVIEEVPVLVLPANEMWRAEGNAQLANFVFHWSDGHVALALGYGSLYNHSYQPNARCEDVRPQTKRFVAIRDIQANEEITFNYGGTVDCQDPVGFKVLD